MGSSDKSAGIPRSGETVMKLWKGRTLAQLDTLADDFNSSVSFDCRMYRQDISGSIAHAAMLAKQNILGIDDAAKIISGLQGILEDIESGELPVNPEAEDIHMFVEEMLTKRIGEAGKWLHTARSRNDQVALDLRMYLRGEINEINKMIVSLVEAITTTAEKNIDAIMPGYTHMQRAQPILFSHQLLAYAFMLQRDLERLKDCRKRMNVSPIGSCALAGTTYPTDRHFEAAQLGFDGICMNSIDGVSDRDFALELLSALSICMMHLSRLSEELILWSSWEFGFIVLSDSYTTGSSIMPQKKNPDVAELIRGKVGRVYGDLIGSLTVFKGLPLAYNKDMQEDKESVFDACDTIKKCLPVMEGMISTMKVNYANMLSAAKKGFINATDLADYLTRKGMPFRDAYRITGEIVAEAAMRGETLDTLPLEYYKGRSDFFEDDLYEAIELETCVRARVSEGGTGPESVKKQIEYFKEFIENERK